MHTIHQFDSNQVHNIRIKSNLSNNFYSKQVQTNSIPSKSIPSESRPTSRIICIRTKTIPFESMNSIPSESSPTCRITLIRTKSKLVIFQTSPYHSNQFYFNHVNTNQIDRIPTKSTLSESSPTFRIIFIRTKPKSIL